MSSVDYSPPRTYPARLFLAFFAAFFLVYFAMIAVGGRGYDMLTLFSGAIVTCVFALLAAAISAAIYKRDLPLVLLSQALTIIGVATFSFWA